MCKDKCLTEVVPLALRCVRKAKSYWTVRQRVKVDIGCHENIYQKNVMIHL